MVANLSLFLLILTFLLCPNRCLLISGRSLSAFINYFEPVNFDQYDLELQHRTKRFATYRNEISPVNFTFTAFNSTFTILLKPDKEIFAKNLSITVYLESSINLKPFNEENYYSGSVAGQQSSLVHGTIKNGTFDGVIYSLNETYYVEPVSRYFRNVHKMPYHSVIFRARDVKDYNVSWNAKCFADRLRPKFSVPRHANVAVTPQSVGKQNDNQRLACILHIIADHLFFDKVGNRDFETTVSEMIYHIREADILFRSTDFNGNGNGDNIGFIIGNISIFTDANITDYKLDPSIDNVDTLLEVFSTYNFTGYCTALLYTYRDFKGTLGLAWLAEDEANGGICSPQVLSGTSYFSYNSGVISFLNHGNRVPRKVSTITTTHELGHSFGSPHDPDNDAKCTPGGKYGNYIMYSYSTDGSKSNNRIFSDCSKQLINKIIQLRNKCFVAYQRGYCGNGVVEADEECDCGSPSHCNVVDPCCTPRGGDGTDLECTVRQSKGFQCSPKSSACCTDNCSIIAAEDNKICSKATECSKEAVCFGNTSQCPKAEFYNDGKLCMRGTKSCHEGLCQGSICNDHQLEECICTASHQQMCHLCCKNASSMCEPAAYFNIKHSNGTLIFKNLGQLCDNGKGFCDWLGTCITTNPEKNFAKLFEKPTREAFAQWFASYWYYVILAVLGLCIIAMLVFVLYGKRIRPVHHQPDPRESFELQCTHMMHMNLTERLQIFFPSVPQGILMHVMKISLHDERQSIERLLAMGYPMRVICRSTPIPETLDVEL